MEVKIATTQGKVGSMILQAQSDTHLSFSVTVDGIQRNFTPNVRDFQSPVLLVRACPPPMFEGAHSS